MENILSTEQGNKMIAEFCGLIPGINGTPDYDRHWELLMLVVEKINNIFAADTPNIWQGELNAKIDKVILLPLCTPIDTVWKAAVQFIQWYNTTKK